MSIFRMSLPASGWSRWKPAADVIVSRCSPPDVDVAAAVAMACRTDAGSGYRISAAGLRGWLEPHPSAPACCELWLARHQAGEPVGAACLSRTRNRAGTRWSIPFLLVVPAARRRGVATTLLREVLRSAEEAGAGHVEVETSTDWIPAVHFWRSIALKLPDAAVVSPAASAARAPTPETRLHWPGG